MESNRNVKQKVKQQTGFTLVEMITVLLLMGLLISMVVPIIQQTYQRIEMDTAIQRLHKDIRWAQQLAEREQTKVTITFFKDAEPRFYRIKATGISGYPRVVEFPSGVDVTASVITIKSDKTFSSNNHVTIQKGEISRYVYYYNTGRSRISAVEDE